MVLIFIGVFPRFGVFISNPVDLCCPRYFCDSVCPDVAHPEIACCYEDVGSVDWRYAGLVLSLLGFVMLFQRFRMLRCMIVPIAVFFAAYEFSQPIFLVNKTHGETSAMLAQEAPGLPVAAPELPSVPELPSEDVSHRTADEDLCTGNDCQDKCTSITEMEWSVWGVVVMLVECLICVCFLIIAGARFTFIKEMEDRLSQWFNPDLAFELPGSETFRGRSVRSEYWNKTIAWIIVLISGLIPPLIYSFKDSRILNIPMPLCPFWFSHFVLIIAMFIALLPVSVRRLHDRGMSGWWVFGFKIAELIPLIGGLAQTAELIIVGCLDGKPGPNQYGEDPKSRKSLEQIIAEKRDLIKEAQVDACDSVESRLQKLVGLRDAGLISETEFYEKRAAVIGSI